MPSKKPEVNKEKPEINKEKPEINKGKAKKSVIVEASVDKKGKDIIEANIPKVEIPQMTSDVATDGSFKKIQNENNS